MKHSRTLVFLVAMSLSATAWSRDAKNPRGKFTVFNAPGAGTAGSEGTSVAGFNQEGVLVGYVSDAGGNLTGFLRNRDGGFTPISDPLTVPGGIGAIPSAVNSNDDVVGIYEPARPISVHQLHPDPFRRVQRHPRTKHTSHGHYRYAGLLDQQPRRNRRGILLVRRYQSELCPLAPGGIR